MNGILWSEVAVFSSTKVQVNHAKNQSLNFTFFSTTGLVTGCQRILLLVSLKDLAIQIGVSEEIAWLYPAIVDGAIIVLALVSCEQTCFKVRRARGQRTSKKQKLCSHCWKLCKQNRMQRYPNWQKKSVGPSLL